ncbi:MAG: choice-of-anchor Q domain-containing protein [Rudaea sp.]
MRPLAAVLVSIFGLSARDAWAAPAVTNCQSEGAGSLRASVAAAAEGDAIDMTTLQCSLISLRDGAIVVSQNNLKINGPGRDKLEISGLLDSKHNVFSHYGAGTLEIDNVKVSSGSLYMSSTGKYFGGGCIGSFGNLALNDVTVSNCVELLGDDANGRGGAIFALGNLTLNRSIVSGNGFGNVYDYGECYYRYGPYGYYLYCPKLGLSSPASERGGGVFAAGSLTITSSTINGNAAYDGGGIYAAGQATISFSTIATNNTADSGAGVATTGAGQLTIVSSTITGNELVGGFLGGIGSTIEGRAPLGTTPKAIQLVNSTIADNGGVVVVKSNMPVSIYNSTIAFNYGVYGFSSETTTAVSMSNAPLTIVSSIIADNYGSDVTLAGTATIAGNHNLIGWSSAPLPPDTLSGCPQLDALADQGGFSQTVLLRAMSPAIGAGANPLALKYDQRGAGYNRSYGGAVDIGAFEWQGEIGDRIFAFNFDSGPWACDL